MASSLEVVIGVVADISPLIRETARAKAVMSGFERSMDRMSGGLRTIGASATSLGTKMTVVTAAISAAAGGALLFARNAASVGDAIGDASAAAGVSAGYFQRMAFAMGAAADMSREEFGDALVKLSKNLGEATQGSTTAIAAFEKIGISQAQLAAGTVTTQQAFDAYVATMDKATNPAIAAAVSAELFGRAGAKMGGQLVGAGKSVSELQARAEELGVVLSNDAVAAAGKFDAKWRELSGALEGLKVKLASSILPFMVDRFIPFLTDKAIPAIGQVVDVIGEWINSFNGLPEGVQTAVLAITAAFAAGGPVLLAIGGVATALSVIFSGPAAPLVLLAAAVVAGSAVWAAWGDEIKAAVGGAVDYVTGKFQALIDFLQSIIDKAKAVGTAISDALNVQPADYSAPDNMLGVGGTGLLGGPVDMGGGGIGEDTANGIVNGFTGKIAERMPEIDSAINSIPARARELLQIQSPSQVFSEIGGFIGEGLANGITSAQGIVASAVGAISGTAVDSTDGMVSDILSGMNTLFGQSKQIGAGIAWVSTLIGAAKEIEKGVFGFASAAAVVAKGVAFVSAIRSAGKGGGGVGGGSVGAASAPQAPMTTMNFSVVNDPFGIGERTARSIIDQMNRAQRNGGKIVGVMA